MKTANNKTNCCLLVLITLIATTSCKEEPYVPEKPDVYWGEFHSLVNGEYREAATYASLINANGQVKLGIVGDYLGPLYEVREAISLVNIPVEPGVTPLGVVRNDSLPYILYAFKDYDVILKFYLVEEGRPPGGFITLEEYDPETKEMRGTFEGIVYNQARTDSLVFTEGYFHTRIRK